MRNRTHWAIVLSSSRIVPVERLGRLLLIIRPNSGQSDVVLSACGISHPVATCRYNERFHLLPAGYLRK
jgi:hypothetical protein